MDSRIGRGRMDRPFELQTRTVPTLDRSRSSMDRRDALVVVVRTAIPSFTNSCDLLRDFDPPLEDIEAAVRGCGRQWEYKRNQLFMLLSGPLWLLLLGLLVYWIARGSQSNAGSPR